MQILGFWVANQRSVVRAISIGVVGLALVAGTKPALAQDIFAGRDVYEDHCASCHGVDGVSTVPGTPHFFEGKGLDFSDAELFRLIKSGRNLMPGYDRVLKESDILNVISYIRTLRR